MAEWVGGVTRVTDVTGPSAQAGTRYVVHFGRMRSPTEVLEADPPRLVRTRFGSTVLRGEQQAVFEEVDGRTRLTVEFRIDGFIPNIAARIFATGSWKGSFKGELLEFARIAEREVARREERT